MKSNRDNIFNEIMNIFGESNLHLTFDEIEPTGATFYKMMNISNHFGLLPIHV